MNAEGSDVSVCCCRGLLFRFSVYSHSRGILSCNNNIAICGTTFSFHSIDSKLMKDVFMMMIANSISWCKE